MDLDESIDTGVSHGGAWFWMRHRQKITRTCFAVGSMCMGVVGMTWVAENSWRWEYREEVTPKIGWVGTYQSSDRGGFHIP
jgi:hypothetical protein